MTYVKKFHGRQPHWLVHLKVNDDLTFTTAILLV
jgi:hypothetical protein